MTVKDELDTPIAKDFLAALKRLQDGCPVNPQNKKKPRVVNFSSVSREAGHSRTLIAEKNCQYPAVRKTVVAAMSAGPPESETSPNDNAGEKPTITAMMLVNDLRISKAELRAERNMYATLLTEADLYIAKLEAKLARLRSDQDRRR
ncbi:hypothetical protein MZK49_00640 [Ensifer sesbaniae]|uniref:hypothetical protein n=1 Tax=Ensifer sesbaniae TaxID=1214071 RepID=UPI0020018610|nr:hypothetical protein [Ensifer sesbaniae]